MINYYWNRFDQLFETLLSKYCLIIIISLINDSFKSYFNILLICFNYFFIWN